MDKDTLEEILELQKENVLMKRFCSDVTVALIRHKGGQLKVCDIKLLLSDVDEVDNMFHLIIELLKENEKLTEEKDKTLSTN